MPRSSAERCHAARS